MSKLKDSFKQSRLYTSLSLPLKFVLVLWVIHVIQFVLGLNLGAWGVLPQHISGLKGILFMPLIHGDFGHLLSNTPPLFAMSALILFFYRKVAIRSFVMIYLLSGLAVWLFARPVFHIGASGVIYGLVSFVFWNGIFRRNLKAIVLSLIVMFYYGSMFAGILPGQEGISWEGHLFGGLVGIFVSYWFKDEIERDEKKPVYSWQLEQEEKHHFLDPDAFDKTKQERMRDNDQSGFGNWYSTRS